MGKPLQGLKFKEMRPFRHDMQIVFQDPYGSLSPRMSVADIIEEGLWVHQPQLSTAEREARVIAALRDVGLDPETRFRYPHEFSGGQRQRIAVARAIVLEPTFVVLDEPTSALDMLIQSQIVDLLRDLQKRHNLTYLFISHDLRVVSALASRLIVMRNGKVVEEGPAAELFAQSAERLHARAVCRGVQSGDRSRAGVVSAVSERRARAADHRRHRELGAGALARALHARLPGPAGRADPGRSRSIRRACAMRRCGSRSRARSAQFPNLEVIFNLGAGVDAVVADATLAGRAAGARRGRRSHPAHDRICRDACADASSPAGLLRGEPAQQGLGAEAAMGRRRRCASASWGSACSGATRREVLARIGFDVAGWSSTAKSIPGVACFAGRSANSSASSRAPMCWSACCR